jgi:hypothetical protein
MRLFKRGREKRTEQVDPVARLVAAVDEFNAALEGLSPGTKLTPWVERRPGQRPLLILNEWTPGVGSRVYPATDADRARDLR